MIIAMTGEGVLRKLVVVLALLLVPGLAWGQKDQKNKKNPPPQQQRQRQQPQPQMRQRQQPQPQQRPQPQMRQGRQISPYQQRQPMAVQPQRREYPRQQPNQRMGAQPRTYPGGTERGPHPGVAQPGIHPVPMENRPGMRPGGAIMSRPQRLLPPQESQERIQSFNRSRAGMSGINSRPLPPGRVIALQNGHHVIETNEGRRLEVRPNGTLERVRMPDGREAAFRADGRIRSFRTPNGMIVEHGFHGERRIVTRGSRGDRVVSMGPHRGYYERPYYTRHGATYVQRTYVFNRVTYTRVYRSYSYNGVTYYRYAPINYYHLGYYRWASSPWPAPVRYQWGWYAAPPPWYAYYGTYFAPAPSYPTASLWLTDFLLAANLEAAYEDHANAEATPGQANATTPEAQSKSFTPQAAAAGDESAQLNLEVKEEVAQEVKQQLADEQTAAANPEQDASAADQPPPALSPLHKTFVVSTTLAEMTDEGQECQLTAGDVIKRLDTTPDQNSSVRTLVRSSKPGDCERESVILVQVNDLQEMHNSFQAQVDSGLKTLAENQGQGGIPSAPDVTLSPGEAPPPAPDAAYAERALQKQQSAADAAETELQQEASSQQDGPNN
jgi:hypothetical protein